MSLRPTPHSGDGLGFASISLLLQNCSKYLHKLSSLLSSLGPYSSQASKVGTKLTALAPSHASDPGVILTQRSRHREDQSEPIYTRGSVSSRAMVSSAVPSLKQLSQSDAVRPIFCLINDKFLPLFPCALPPNTQHSRPSAQVTWLRLAGGQPASGNHSSYHIIIVFCID